MITVEIITINDKEYRRTASDTYYIEREGHLYVEAVDPINIIREYTETDIPLPEPEPDPEPDENQGE